MNTVYVLILELSLIVNVILFLKCKQLFKLNTVLTKNLESIAIDLKDLALKEMLKLYPVQGFDTEEKVNRVSH
jgi:hypothetical protein